jgi:hypothetical protein
MRSSRTPITRRSCRPSARGASEGLGRLVFASSDLQCGLRISNAVKRGKHDLSWSAIAGCESDTDADIDADFIVYVDGRLRF